MKPPIRSDYSYFLPIQTRWSDNDRYGHVNNVVYYAYFDTIANQFLIEEGDLDIHSGKVIGYVVNSQCQYVKGVSFPNQLEGGFRVNRIGNSSVEYGIAIFKADEEQVAAYGTFTHVFVDRESEKPTAIPVPIRRALESQLVTKHSD